MVKRAQVPLSSYTRELGGEVSKLYLENPRGIPLSALMSYYGETYMRTLKACQLLSGQGKARLILTSSGSYLLFPKDVEPPKYSDLSLQQAKLLQLLQTTALKGTKGNRLVRTDYSELQRLIGASPNGLINSLKRLEKLGWVYILEKPKPGHQHAMLLTVRPETDPPEVSPRSSP